MTYAAEPVVAAYLRDLVRYLGDASPAERANVLGAVADQIDESAAMLGRAPTQDDLQSIVTNLGPAQDVAASRSRTALPVAPEVEQPRRRRSLTDQPVGVVLVVLVGIGLGLVLPLLGWIGPASMLFLSVLGFMRSRNDDESHKAGWRTSYVVAVPAFVVSAFIMVAALMASASDA